MFISDNRNITKESQRKNAALNHKVFLIYTLNEQAKSGMPLL